MARYIDAILFEQKLADKDIFFPALFKNELNNTPTADVVPKSEVERLREINSLLTEAGQEWQKRYENLAREIFEEIEKTVFADMNFFKELKKKYTDPKKCTDCRYFVGCEKAVWVGICDEYKEVEKMRMHQKVFGKRYHIYARRGDSDRWSEWAQSNDIERALEHYEKIKSLGYQGRVLDAETKEAVVSD